MYVGWTLSCDMHMTYHVTCTYMQLYHMTYMCMHVTIYNHGTHHDLVDQWIFTDDFLKWTPLREMSIFYSCPQILLKCGHPPLAL